jgi:uridine kinase
VTYQASIGGLRKLSKVFPEIMIVVGRIQEASERRWIDTRYCGA